MTAPVWAPSTERIARARLTAFRQSLRQRTSVDVTSYGSLHQFSINDPDTFWTALWDFADVGASIDLPAVQDPERVPGARFFPNARLNFAEVLLRRADEGVAIVFWGENRVRRTLTRADLYAEVSRLAQALQSAGVGQGDRVAGFLPNLPETVIAALAAASLGAIWSSASPDFGAQGVIDRFGQIAPKVLIAADGYFYGGKTHDCLGRLATLAGAMPGVEHVVVVPYTSEGPALDGIPRSVRWPEFVAPFRPGPIDFAPLSFNHPLYVLYSSGTTGPPKSIVHGAGGTLIQHLKEHQLHCDVQPNDRVFYYTTCGWMMWNWLVTALASGAALLLYDGSPFFPDGNALFDFADAAGATLFGTSARFIAAVEKAGLAPMRTHSLTTLRTITSTGSPLAPESFDFVYRSIKRDVHLASISGGTDIVGCFALGDPTGPVWRGELQVPALGMDVAVFDEDGRPVRGQKGELVCRNAFPSMPLGFWNDPGGSKYRAAYFERFPGVWHHGDYAEVTEHGGFIIHGRSDAVLNPGGVRIGTAEIYREVEQIDQVLECLAVGQAWGGDERIVLFVKLRPGASLDDELRRSIVARIRQNLSPRHVPAKILEVADLPRTKSNKLVELAVRDVINGREVRNREALANPESLDLFRHLPSLES